jgi:restriction system protein
MSRRKEKGSLDGLAEIMDIGPVWLGPVLAAVVFILGWYVIPALLTDKPGEKIPTGYILVPIARQITPYFAGLVLFMWAVIRLKKFATRRSFDTHANRESIRELSWRQFEGYVAETFRRQGYFVEQTGDPAGDGGVDVVLHKDGQKTLVQCKHWKAFKVGVGPVRELLGVVTSEGAQAGVLATSGTFTAEAREFARDNRIRLIDGAELERLVQSIQGSQPAGAPAGISPSPASPQVTEADNSPPACPRCGSAMVMRMARKGASAGSKFWGCPAYPKCKGTRPA